MNLSTRRPPALRIFAVAEWLMILPATLLLAAAVLRGIQPRQYEPAYTSWIFFEWATGHISRSGAAVLFLGLPGFAALLGLVMLLRIWRRNPALCQDAVATLAAVKRNAAIGLLSCATLLAAVILSAAVAHIITD